MLPGQGGANCQFEHLTLKHDTGGGRYYILYIFKLNMVRFFPFFSFLPVVVRSSLDTLVPSRPSHSRQTGGLAWSLHAANMSSFIFSWEFLGIFIIVSGSLKNSFSLAMRESWCKKIISLKLFNYVMFRKLLPGDNKKEHFHFSACLLVWCLCFIRCMYLICICICSWRYW